MAVSDSLIEDIISLVGTENGAGIILSGGNNTVVHAHPTNIPIGIVNAALTNNSYVGTECDTIGHYCIDLEGTGGTAVIGTNSYTNGHVLPGFSDFYFGAHAGNVTFGTQGNLCSPGSVPSDFHEFITPEGPYDAGHPLPVGVVVSGNDESCVNIGTFAGFPGSLVGKPVVSGASIALSGEVQHVMGNSTISTIAPPAGFSSTVGGCVTLIADGLWSTTLGGNIETTMHAARGSAYEACYDGLRWRIEGACSNCAVKVAQSSTTVKIGPLDSHSCAPPVTVRAPSVLVDDVVQVSYQEMPSEVGKNVATNSGRLAVTAFATDTSVTFTVCDVDSKPLETTSLRINWQVMR
jgi:hypothetical protein